MRLFAALLFKKMPHGHIYRGKDRLIQRITPSHIQDIKNKFQIEERNMFLLRHPYLTPEESRGHSFAMGKQQERMRRLIQTKKEFRDHVKLEDRLGHLRYKEAWD